MPKPGLPDLLFVIDSNKEAIAVKEARKLGIPVVAVVDTNCDPELTDMAIPSNNESRSAIQCILRRLVLAVQEGRNYASRSIRAKTPK